MSFEHFAQTFANGLPANEMQAAYDTQIVQAPGRIFFQAALGGGNRVDFNKSGRAPLLLIAGEQDQTAPQPMVKAMYRKYTKISAVDMLEFKGRSHWLIAEPGWAEVAEGIWEWLKNKGQGSN